MVRIEAKDTKCNSTSTFDFEKFCTEDVGQDDAGHIKGDVDQLCEKYGGPKNTEYQAKEAWISYRPICRRYAVDSVSLATGYTFRTVFEPYEIADLRGIDKPNPKDSQKDARQQAQRNEKAMADDVRQQIS